MIKIKPASIHAKKLYEALKKRGLNCVLEYWDEHKHIDMGLRDAKLYIEVDGSEHYLDPNQIIADFERDNYSEDDGFDTFRVSNEIIDKYLDKLADAIKVVANRRIGKK